jgi:hypothetical protein
LVQLFRLADEPLFAKRSVAPWACSKVSTNYEDDDASTKWPRYHLVIGFGIANNAVGVARIDCPCQQLPMA